MQKTYFILIALTGILFASCSKKSDPSNPQPQTTLSLRDTLTIYGGNIFQFDVSVTPTSYDTTKLVWASSDTAVVAVTNRGKITAKNAGTSKVSVSTPDKSKSISCFVTVKDSLTIALLAYYPFNNSTADSSGHHFDGVPNNLTATTDRFGKTNSAYSFDGTSSYIDVKDNPVLRLSNTDFTINYWVNLAYYSTSYGSLVISKRGDGSANGWLIGVGGYGDLTNNVGVLGTTTFDVSGGSDPFAAGKLLIGLNSWHMITAVYNWQHKQMSIYLDGNLDTVTSNIPTPNVTTASDLFIGGDSQGLDNQDALEYFIKGKLDNIRIYNRILKASEINKLYHLTY